MCTTVADSYVTAASQSAGSVAQQAADRKCQEYGELSAAYEFQPAAVETHGPTKLLKIYILKTEGCKNSIDHCIIMASVVEMLHAHASERIKNHCLCCHAIYP